MDVLEHVQLARDAFRDDLAQQPALTLRGANAVDGYDHPEPFDPALDEPTDEYLERFTFWAMPYLDARSWRHYLPRFIESRIPTIPRWSSRPRCARSVPPIVCPLG